MPAGFSLVVTGIAVLATIALLIGGFRMIGKDRLKGVLMIIAAFVLLFNVLIWTWPAT